MVVAVASLVGTPTGGALLKTTDEKHFRNLIVFCGALSVAGTLVMSMAGMVDSDSFRRCLPWDRKPEESVSRKKNLEA